jgi:hypothetical protein
VAAIAMVLGVACSSSTSDQAKVKTVVKGFLADTVDGRATQACSALTGDALRFVSSVGAVAGTTASCPDAVKTLSGLYAADEAKALKNAKIEKVTISGDRATIAPQDVKIDYQGQSHIFPARSGGPIVVLKTDAGWKLDSLG